MRPTVTESDTRRLTVVSNGAASDPAAPDVVLDAFDDHAIVLWAAKDRHTHGLARHENPLDPCPSSLAPRSRAEGTCALCMCSSIDRHICC